MEHTITHCMQALLAIASRRNTRCHPNRSGRCPRCGQGHLFSDLLKLRFHCEVCGLDYSHADPADGPAFFVIGFVCIPTVILALWIEAKFGRPYWAHLVTTLPLLLLTCIPPLRPLKGWLAASQCFYKAGKARFGTAAPIQPPVTPPADNDLHPT